MPTTNNNKPVDMKQLWQQMEPCISLSSAVSCATTSEDGSDRFIYYIVAGLFYRYDTYGNTWHKLAAPAALPATLAQIRYSKYSGHMGRVLDATSTSVKIAGLTENVFTNMDIWITQGTGAGQKRTITACPAPVVVEQGLATSANNLLLGDSTKKWKFNQWAGYQVRITAGTGTGNVRKILYNDATTLTVSDPNFQPIEPFNNAPFFPAPVATAGVQAHYVIESTDLTIGSAWTTTPDATSSFRIDSGGIWLLTSAASPFASIQYYSVAGDYWVNKTVSANLYLAALGTDASLERTGEVGGIYESGTATGGGSHSLDDSALTMTPNQYRNYRIRITGGLGVGQSRRIMCNTVTKIETVREWTINPDITSTYEILADRDKLYLAGNGQAAMHQYDVDADLIVQANKYDDGIANILAARLPGLENPTFAITTGVRSTGGITGIVAAPTAGGTNYVVGDILTVTTGGTNGKVMVEAVSAGGVVTSLSLLRAGATYTTGTGKATSGGSGTLCTVEIATTGTVCFVTTAINHHFKIGQSVVLSGDALYAGIVTITGCDALNTFDFVTSAAGNMTAANALSATQLVDTTKAWEVGEHIGRIVQTHLVGTAGAMVPRLVTASTATTLTFATITTAPVNGTGRYVITENPAAFGQDEQYKREDRKGVGFATSGTTVTLVDTTKNWATNQWAGARMRIKGGTGRDTEIIVTSNTATTLTYPTQAFSPDATSYYQIQDTFGNCTGAGSTTTMVDTTKKWAVNQWAGKRVRITGGAGFGLTAALNELTIVSNTIDTLTFAAVTGFAPDATTTYTILGVPAKGSGIELIWAFGGVSAGKYIYCARGSASNIIDRYNINTSTWEYPLFITPQTDTLTTGSYYAYDGANRIYFSPGVAVNLVQYVYYLDLTNNRVYGLGSVPNIQGTPVQGNRMEIITSPAGIDYLYHIRNSAGEMYRTQLFF